MNLNALIHLTGLLLLSVLLGGAVGMERERHDRPAGLRTHILVCLGSALITLISNSTESGGGRIAAQIVTGVGFLGAGTIIRDTSGGPVRGLTTAASLWAVAGVGIAVGYGGLYAALAGIATIIILITLAALDRLEGMIDKSRRQQMLTIVFQPGPDLWANIKTTLATFHNEGIRLRDLYVEKVGGGELLRVRVRFPRGVDRQSVSDVLIENSGILHFDWSD